MADRFRNRSGMNRNHMSSTPRTNSLPSNSCQGKGGCQRSEMPSASGNCKTLMRRLQAVDFSLADTILYLDAYPHSCEAMSHYNELLKEREALTRSLASSCHMPVTNTEPTGSDTWLWVNGPWPWSIEAN